MIKKMTQENALVIKSWKYEEPYNIYNITDVKELLEEPYYVLYNEELIGYFCIGSSAQVPPYEYSDDYIDIGFGMKPNLTGKGNGYKFLERCISFVENNQNKPLRLTVAKFNKRAIKLYKNHGFKKVTEFDRNDKRFVIMTRLK